MQGGNGLLGMRVCVCVCEFLLDSGHLGLGEPFQPFTDLYDVWNQISKEECLRASSLSWGERVMECLIEA